MTVFNKIAHHYDSSKQLELASIIIKEIETEIGGHVNKVMLDYGCGTGLIGLEIAEKFEKSLLVDPSEEMIRIVDQKISQKKLTDVKAIIGSFSKGDRLSIKADLIIVSLVLLHVPETVDLLQNLYQALNPQGRIIIVDFDKNEKINHENVHNGFSQIELRNHLEVIGFKSVTSRTFYHGKQLFMKQDASLFRLIAEK